MASGNGDGEKSSGKFSFNPFRFLFNRNGDSSTAPTVGRGPGSVVKKLVVQPSAAIETTTTSSRTATASATRSSSQRSTANQIRTTSSRGSAGRSDNSTRQTGEPASAGHAGTGGMESAKLTAEEFCLQKFASVLDTGDVDLEKLRRVSWRGIPR